MSILSNKQAVGNVQNSMKKIKQYQEEVKALQKKLDSATSDQLHLLRCHDTIHEGFNIKSTAQHDPVTAKILKRINELKNLINDHMRIVDPDYKKKREPKVKATPEKPEPVEVPSECLADPIIVKHNGELLLVNQEILEEWQSIIDDDDAESVRLEEVEESPVEVLTAALATGDIEAVNAALAVTNPAVPVKTEAPKNTRKENKPVVENKSEARPAKNAENKPNPKGSRTKSKMETRMPYMREVEHLSDTICRINVEYLNGTGNETLAKEQLAQAHTRYLDLRAKIRADAKSIDPEIVEAARDLVDRGQTALQSSIQLIYNRSVPVVDWGSWEELMEGEGHLSSIPPANTQAKLLDSIEVKFPFSDKPVYEQAASHTIMNASRIVVSTFAYLRAAKRAAARLTHHPQGRHAVMDIGAGSFGCERLMVLRTNPAYKKIYLHACVPDVDEADTARLEKMRGNSTYMDWNYLPVTHTPKLMKLNFCHHRAHECTCLGLYESVQPVAIHSGYYFQERDFHNVLSKANSLECVMHIPKLGEQIPLDKPEYEWVSATADQASDAARRMKAKVKGWLTGIPDITLKPLRTGGTPYTHPDMSEMLKNGGFHGSKNTRDMEPELQGDWRTAKRYGFIAASAAASTFLGMSFAGATTAAKIVSSALNAATLTAGCAAVDTALMRRRNKLDPGYEATETYTAHIISSYGQYGTGEEIAHIIQFKMKSPTPLLPQTVESLSTDTTQQNRATAAVLMGSNSEKTYRQIGASLLRDNVPLKKVRDTIVVATHQVNYLVGRHTKDPPLPTSSFRGTLISFCLPVALTALARGISIAAARSQRSPALAVVNSTFEILQACVAALIPLSFLLVILRIFFSLVPYVVPWPSA